jgi:transcriptional regulator with XRE-family HTH domain
VRLHADAVDVNSAQTRQPGHQRELPPEKVPFNRTAENIGQRLRMLRLERGMTQTELAGGRLSKEYVSQIERGAARPTVATLDWLARQLRVERDYLQGNLSSAEHARAEAVVTNAEAAHASGRFEDVLAILAPRGDEFRSRSLRLRALLVEASARLSLGQVDAAQDLAARANQLAQSADFDDLDRAQALFQLGLCRLARQSLSTAIELLSEALTCAERVQSSSRLRVAVLEHRSQCYRLQRKCESARADLESALQIAATLENSREQANLLLEEARSAEAAGAWARASADAGRAKLLYEQGADRSTVGRLLGSLGSLSLALGETDGALGFLNQACAVALETKTFVEAGEILGSLAMAHLRRNEYRLAEVQASRALGYLAGSEAIELRGRAKLVLGRALLAQDELDKAEVTLRDAEATLLQLSSAQKLAPVMVARGDLAARRADHVEAARCYRAATEALQDFRF